MRSGIYRIINSINLNKNYKKMTDEKKRELFPYFAYIYSQEINPEKYGQVESIEDWSNLIQSNQADIEKITQAAEQMSDEDWDALDQQYTEQSKASEDQQVISAKKGAKLMKLKSSAKKCKCGCEMITSKAEGGKIVSKCACGCSTAKKEKGGEINKKIDNVKVSINKKQTGGDIEKPSSAVEKKGGRIKPKMQNGGKYNESEHAALIEKYKSKKTSGSDLKRLQELNKTSGHHEDGWEPKKAKATIVPKPKVDEKKVVDRIGKHKLGGILKAESGTKVEKMDNSSYSKLTPDQKRERLKAKNSKPTDKKSYSKVFLEKPERKDESRTNPNRNMDNGSYSRLFPEQKKANRDGIDPYAWVRPTMDIPVAQKTFGPGAWNNVTGSQNQQPQTGFKPATEVPTPGYRTAPPTMLPEVVVTAPRISNQSTPTATPAYDTNTLWGWMKSTGTGDASYGGRRDLWNKFYGSGTTAVTGYTGSVEQNARLLEALKKAGTMGVGIEKAANLTNLTQLRAPQIKK